MISGVRRFELPDLTYEENFLDDTSFFSSSFLRTGTLPPPMIHWAGIVTLPAQNLFFPHLKKCSSILLFFLQIPVKIKAPDLFPAQSIA